MIRIDIPSILTECHFEPISDKECPFSDLKDLIPCSKDMNHTDICEADTELPNGDRDVNINNCRVSFNDSCSPNCEYDVYKCHRSN